jgi:hypothetical protein
MEHSNVMQVRHRGSMVSLDRQWLHQSPWSIRTQQEDHKGVSKLMSVQIGSDDYIQGKQYTMYSSSRVRSISPPNPRTHFVWGEKITVPSFDRAY